jgi:hypothetical protein
MISLSRIGLAVISLTLITVSVAGCQSEQRSGIVATQSTEEWSGPSSKATTLFPARHDSKWGYIDDTGKLILDFQYDEALPFADGMAAIRIGVQWGYIDDTGRLAIAPQFETPYSFSQGLVQLVSGAAVGFMDKSGRTVIETQFATANGFHEGLAAVSLNDGSGYIDVSGKVVLRLPGITAAEDFSEGLAVVSEDGICGYINKLGEYAFERRFLYATEFCDGLAVVEYDSYKYGVIDKTGRLVKALHYDRVEAISEGRAPVINGGEFAAWRRDDASWTEAKTRAGYVDEAGELVIPLNHAVCNPFQGGLALVEDDSGKLAYIDLGGSYVWREQ